MIGLNYEYLGLLDEDYIGYYIFNHIKVIKGESTDKVLY